jgi:hypothetical protein
MREGGGEAVRKGEGREGGEGKGREYEARRQSRRTHFGSDLGAHTTANDSESMHWRLACVCRSMEDMKHDCEGWVWICE